MVSSPEMLTILRKIRAEEPVTLALVTAAPELATDDSFKAYIESAFPELLLSMRDRDGNSRNNKFPTVLFLLVPEFMVDLSKDEKYENRSPPSSENSIKTWKLCIRLSIVKVLVQNGPEAPDSDYHQLMTIVRENTELFTGVLSWNRLSPDNKKRNGDDISGFYTAMNNLHFDGVSGSDT